MVISKDDSDAMIKKFDNKYSRQMGPVPNPTRLLILSQIDGHISEIPEEALKYTLGELIAWYSEVRRNGQL